MAFDINPFSFIGDLYNTGKMEKYYKLFVSCSIAAFVGFWGTLGIVGGNVLAATNDPIMALCIAFFAACTVMAGSVIMSVKRAKIWKDLSVVLPGTLEKTITTTDVTKVNNA